MRIFITVSIGLFMLSACERHNGETIEFFGSTMGTSYSLIVAETELNDSPATLHKAIETRLETLENQMSTYRAASELSRFNHSVATDWHPVSAALLDVVNAALALSRDTRGAFDITVGPLVDLWGFGAKEIARPPTASEVARQRERVGFSSIQVQLQPQAALKKARPDSAIDVSAIAKGYAVDQLAALLVERGVANFLVEIGGEVRVSGSKPGSKSGGKSGGKSGDKNWRIAVEKPVADKQLAQVIIPLSNGAVSTSGSYRNFYRKDGQKFSHAIDPATGYPVEHNLLSVTVIDNSAMLADGMATALLVMGTERGLRWANERNIPALFISAENSGHRFWCSDAMAALAATNSQLRKICAQ